VETQEEHLFTQEVFFAIKRHSNDRVTLRGREWLLDGLCQRAGRGTKFWALSFGVVLQSNLDPSGPEACRTEVKFCCPILSAFQQGASVCVLLLLQYCVGGWQEEGIIMDGSHGDVSKDLTTHAIGV
jgi:hypothetical protein